MKALNRVRFGSYAVRIGRESGETNMWELQGAEVSKEGTNTPSLIQYSLWHFYLSSSLRQPWGYIRGEGGARDFFVPVAVPLQALVRNANFKYTPGDWIQNVPLNINANQRCSLPPGASETAVPFAPKQKLCMRILDWTHYAELRTDFPITGLWLAGEDPWINSWRFHSYHSSTSSESAVMVFHYDCVPRTDLRPIYVESHWYSFNFTHVTRSVSFYRQACPPPPSRDLLVVMQQDVC